MAAEERRLVSLLPVDHPCALPAARASQQDAAQFFGKHFGRDAVLTLNGRAAIGAILDSLDLKRSDEICVLTTFDFPNVSSCVTSTVFNYCKPSRVMSPATRAVLVIHEFGVPYKDMAGLIRECRSLEIPLIEDCAHTINSVRDERLVGTMGDWAICSLPKIFPVRAGGVLIGRRINDHLTAERTGNSVEVGRNVEPYLEELPGLSTLRRKAYRKLSEYARQIDLQPVFEVTDKITPWFFPLSVTDAPRMMEAAARTGVECGRWHGTNIIVFPCHQNLTEDDLAHIGAVFESGLNTGR